jgi:phosphoribosyl-AMP cyclohydrolase
VSIHPEPEARGTFGLVGRGSARYTEATERYRDLGEIGTIVRDSIEPLPLADVLKWNSDGLIPAVVQDVETGDVLMLAWMDEPALRATIETGQTHFYSRSRRSHWHKGGTSGHVQYVESIRVDCDGDVILIKARQVGGACHEGYRSCFFRRLGAEGWEVDARPVFDAAAVYGPADRPAAEPASG